MVMLTTIGVVVAVGVVSTVTARAVLPLSTLNKRAVAFFDPVTGGGSWLDDAGSGGGEPLNVILSADIPVYENKSNMPFLSIGCYFWPEFPRRSHRRWHHKLCKGDRIVCCSSKLVCCMAC